MARNSRQRAPISIMKSFKTKPDFPNVLKNLSVDQFTVDDLTKAYLNSSDTIHHSKTTVEHFYRQVAESSVDIVNLRTTKLLII